LALRALIHSGVVKSAHDCSDGGLAVALAECCISQQIARDTPQLIGAQIDFTPHPPPTDEPDSEVARPAPQSDDSASKSEPAYDPDPLSAAIKGARLDALLFGETQGRIIISVAGIDAVKVLARAKILGVPAAWIGTIGGDSLRIKAPACEFSWQITELHDLWWNSIARAMK
jgi:phosphoribosylformylglycinamidine synthase